MRSPPNGTFCHSDLEASNNDFLQVLSLSLSIRSSSWIYIIIITITILIIHFNITMFIKGVRRLDFGSWWLKPKKRRLLLWRRKCNNCSRYLWWTLKIWKHPKNMLKSECLNWQLREGLIWCWWQLTKAFVIPMAHFWNQLLPLQTRCDSPTFRYSDIPIFWHSKILVFQYFDIVMFCTHCFLGSGGDVVPFEQGILKKLLLECCWSHGAPAQSPVSGTSSV